MASKAKMHQGNAPAEVLHPAAQPLPAVRSAAAVYRKFGICRICFRKLADDGLIPGVKKASW